MGTNAAQVIFGDSIVQESGIRYFLRSAGWVKMRADVRET